MNTQAQNVQPDVTRPGAGGNEIQASEGKMSHVVNLSPEDWNKILYLLVPLQDVTVPLTTLKRDDRFASSMGRWS
jgi:hypothetical protein